MERLYSIDGIYAEIIIEKDIYPLVVIEKAVSNFMDEVYIKINNENDNKVKIKLVSQNEQDNKNRLERIIGEFYNELLREDLRYNISKETKNLRELIVGRALYTACIELSDEEKIFDTPKENIEENNQNIEEDYNLDEIAVNWFDNNR